MKLLKILYCVSVGICLIQLGMYLLGPFGGPNTIFDIIKSGMYAVKVDATGGYQIISLNSPL